MRLMTPPLPAVATFEQADDLQPLSLDPLLELDQLDLKSGHLGFVGLGVELAAALLNQIARGGVERVLPSDLATLATLCLGPNDPLLEEDDGGSLTSEGNALVGPPAALFCFFATWTLLDAHARPWSQLPETATRRRRDSCYVSPMTWLDRCVRYHPGNALVADSLPVERLRGRRVVRLLPLSFFLKGSPPVKGLDPALIGLATSLGSVAYSFALPAWGHMGDVMTGPRRALQLACIPAAVFALGLSAPLPMVAVIACLVFVTAGGGPTAALTDAMTMPILANASREYSRLRLLSSFGGRHGHRLRPALQPTGYVAAPFVYMVTMGLMIFSAHKLPLGRDSERHRKARGAVERRARSTPARGRFGSVGEALFGRPRLLAVLASALLIFIGFMAAATYISVRISDLGGGAVEVGLSNGVAWGAEIPGLILAGWLVARVGLRPVLVVSAVGFAVCLASWIVFVDAGTILFTRFISGIFFGGILITFVLTIAQLLPARLQATGQTLFPGGGLRGRGRGRQPPGRRSLLGGRSAGRFWRRRDLHPCGGRTWLGGGS